MTATYRKTATITATQWFKLGDHPAVVMKSDPNRYADEGIPWCPTMEGGHIVTPGDWIATGVKGEHWPIKPDVFAETYTPVDAALSTPATEPQGYVEGLTGFRGTVEQLCNALGEMALREKRGAQSCILKAALAALAARPAPQPAADTRVVVKPLVWSGVQNDIMAEASGVYHIREERCMVSNARMFVLFVNSKPVSDYSSFKAAKSAAQAHYESCVGTATPAPSDKIAEAVRDKTAAELVIDAYDAANPFRQADMHPALCHCNRCAIDWLRALAGKGE